MDKKLMAETAAAMVASGKGLLAADESSATVAKRFSGVHVENTEPNRRAYRDMLFTTPDIGNYISGVILFDETIRQASLAGPAFPKLLESQGILPGIKVDGGAKDMPAHPGEQVTEGLDGLRARLDEYFKLGARFAKWRAVINIGADIPSAGCIEANAHALARYSALCQEANIVPIVEPEVLIDGDHTIERCFEVTEATLRATFQACYTQRVSAEHMILKASMVVSGKGCSVQASEAQVAEMTVTALRRSVPAALPGVVFLSGGQSDEKSAAHLSAMNSTHRAQLPWPLTYSYSRALHQAALKAWSGKQENWKSAQAVFAHRARMCSLAAQGKYSPAEEKKAA
ncbi:MAG: fructose-bisphosphate aldolase class I [Proteobacteria bacterium]|nr:fructose-bisphosphate aldolase class I [Burkholderiales bacterium]